MPEMDPIENGTTRHSADAPLVIGYGHHLLQLGAAHDLIIYNGLHRWPMSRGLTCFHDATTRSLPTTRSSGRAPTRTMPQNPWYDDECKELRSYLVQERTSGHMTTSEAHQISWRLTRRKKWAFLTRRMEEVISSFCGPYLWVGIAI